MTVGSAASRSQAGASAGRRARHLLGAAGGVPVVVIVLLLGAARADESSAARTDELTPAADRAIERGLERLIALQQPGTGEFGPQFTVASTSLAGLALLASGETWNRGERSRSINAAVHYLLNQAMKRSPANPSHIYFANERDTQGKTHAHGFAVLFLAECYGTTERDEEIAAALRGAIQTTLAAQTTEGGWGYHFRWEATPDRDKDEASVTITQIQALRACRNAGFAVPSDRIEAAVRYVRRSINPDGSCKYSLTMGGQESKRTSYELTAAAVATLNASGVYDSEQLRDGLGFLERSLNRVKSPGSASTDFYFYGNLYAAMAMFQAGGRHWASWYPGMRKELIEKQTTEGGWEDPRSFGEAYATASALLILQMPRRYLPIFAE